MISTEDVQAHIKATAKRDARETSAERSHPERRRFIRRRLLVLALVVICGVPLWAQTGDRLDGNGWRDVLGQRDRLSFAAGLLNGVSQLSAAFMVGDEDLPPAKGGEMMYRLIKYVQGVSAEQLRDGMNVFCEDFRNRRIDVVSAAYVVVLQIKGKPQADIDALTERLRAAVK